MARSALRLLHYWWPPVLGWSLAVVIAHASGQPIDRCGLVALVAGILAAYSLDRAFDRSRAEQHGRLAFVLAPTALAASVVCAVAAWQLPWTNAVVVPVLGAASLLYPWLKRPLVTKVVLLPAIWTLAAIALPFDDGTWFAWGTLRRPVTLPLFLLIGAGCLLCDLKDERSDRRAGVHSLPALLGNRSAARIGLAVAIAGAGTALDCGELALAVGGALLGLAALRPTLLATDVTGPLLVDVILTVPGALVALGIR